MASLRVVLDPERQGQGLGLDVDPETLIHLADDAEIVITGLQGGMQSGKPSMAFAFTLPDGRAVIAETSWRLFALAFWRFAERFGEEKPDLSGMAVEYDSTGAGDKVRLDLKPDDQPQWFQCELCGARVDAPPGEEGARKIAGWVHRHYREKHPRRASPL